jgi:hypothetical protein
MSLPSILSTDGPPGVSVLVDSNDGMIQTTPSAAWSVAREPQPTVARMNSTNRKGRTIEGNAPCFLPLLPRRNLN